MRISETTIKEVNARLDAVAVVQEYVRLEKRGGRFWGCCPFHNEKTASFTVDLERKLYYCFGCHKGGTVISFMMEMEKVSFPEAVETLAKRLGIEVVYDGVRDNREERENAIRKEELYDLYQRVAGSFHHWLLKTGEGKPALDYLVNRGVSGELIERFRLGYTPRDRSWLFTFLSGKGYSPEFLAASGLFSPKYPRSSFFSGRLMFPVADRQGRTVAFGARFLAAPGEGDSGESPKYINSLESWIYKKGQTLFAIDQAKVEIRRTKEAYLAEGYMDVIALHQAGIVNAVAPLGTAFTEEQAKLLRQWADRVNLIFDADKAGQEAAVKAVLTCRKNGLSASVVIPGQGLPGEGAAPSAFKDPADILKEKGPEALQKSAKCCINEFEYLVNRARVLFDLSGAEGKAKAVSFIFPYAAAMDSEVSRNACIEDIAVAFGVERQAVEADFEQYSRTDGQRRGTITKDVPPPHTKVIRMTDELFLLTAVSVNPGWYPKVRASLSSALPIEEIDDPQAKELFIALEEWFRNDAPGMDDLLARIQDEALRNFVIEQAASQAFSHKPELLFEESVKRIRQKRLERRQAGIIAELGIQKRGDMGRALEDLLAEKVYVDAELLRLKEADQ
ncbi:MAG: DNA primase [Spirochaetaceae bacterium]|jgi:DNA primase|nr:DNA primase [Spirochaetaceae bacterium]